jgi:hypothetical protein
VQRLETPPTRSQRAPFPQAVSAEPVVQATSEVSATIASHEVTAVLCAQYADGASPLLLETLSAAPRYGSSQSTDASCMQ